MYMKKLFSDLLIISSKRNSFTTTDEKAVITPHKKGTPVHVKASINHNDLLRFFGENKRYQYISDGDKIKWVYLKNNPIGMETIAFKGFEDSPKVIKFIKEYATNKNLTVSKIFRDWIDWLRQRTKDESRISKEIPSYGKNTDPKTDSSGVDWGIRIYS